MLPAPLLPVVVRPVKVPKGGNVGAAGIGAQGNGAGAQNTAGGLYYASAQAAERNRTRAGNAGGGRYCPGSVYRKVPEPMLKVLPCRRGGANCAAGANGAKASAD